MHLLLEVMYFLHECDRKMTSERRTLQEKALVVVELLCVEAVVYHAYEKYPRAARLNCE